MSDTIGVLVMAYGTAAGPHDIERYYTDIRGGRPPTPEHLRELVERYEAIGNVFPLLDTTRAQAEGLAERLNADGGATYVPYLGMKHSPPFISEAVEQMLADGIERAIGIVMAPHWSGMSVETYIERVLKALDEQGGHISCTFVRHYHDHPAFVDFLSERVAEVVDELPDEEVESTAVIFSAHSLPIRLAEDTTFRCKYCDCEAICRYQDGLQETADLVAKKLDIDDYTIGWQSAGRTNDPWWGPPIEELIEEAAQTGHQGVIVCSAGFVADHLEILFDLDIEAKEIAEGLGISFRRTKMPNADPAYLDVLAEVVRDHLEEVHA
jgi:ferrochelatase